jgi:hypothetical protein
VREVPVNVFDAEVELLDLRTYSGELLAVDDTSVYLLTGPKRTLAIPRRVVQKVTVSLLASTAVGAGLWTAAGTVSTVSHGYYLVFTAPLWLATGIPSSIAAASHETYAEAANHDLGRMYQFARFPQGLPGAWPTVPLAIGEEPAPAPAPVPVPDAGPDAAPEPF